MLPGKPGSWKDALRNVVHDSRKLLGCAGEPGCMTARHADMPNYMHGAWRDVQREGAHARACSAGIKIKQPFPCAYRPGQQS
jgi:hypothetical protein